MNEYTILCCWLVLNPATIPLVPPSPSGELNRWDLFLSAEADAAAVELETFSRNHESTLHARLNNHQLAVRPRGSARLFFADGHAAHIFEGKNVPTRGRHSNNWGVLFEELDCLKFRINRSANCTGFLFSDVLLFEFYSEIKKIVVFGTWN